MNWYNMSFEEIERYVRNNGAPSDCLLIDALIEKFNELSRNYDELEEDRENTIDELKTQLRELKDEIRTIIS